jgi:hypothetical protein
MRRSNFSGKEGRPGEFIFLVSNFGCTITLRRHGAHPLVPIFDQTNLLLFQYSEKIVSIEIDNFKEKRKVIIGLYLVTLGLCSECRDCFSAGRTMP